VRHRLPAAAVDLEAAGLLREAAAVERDRAATDSADVGADGLDLHAVEPADQAEADVLADVERRVRPEVAAPVGSVDDRPAAVARVRVVDHQPARVEAADHAAAGADDHQATRIVDGERPVAGQLAHGRRPGGKAEADYEHDEY